MSAFATWALAVFVVAGTLCLLACVAVELWRR